MFLRLKTRDVLFVCSSPIDEVWVRSTALLCHSSGLRIEIAICGQRSDYTDQVLHLYREAGIKTVCGMTLAKAARIPCYLAVTASSGLDRKIFPTRAKAFIHMPHSLVSLHMIYPADAFDGHDVLFSAGPHHDTEFEAITKSRKLKPRRSIATGYGKLDVLVQQLFKRKASSIKSPLILLAPSWGSDNLLDRCGVMLVNRLVASGFNIVVRPHPLFFLDRAPIIDVIQTLANQNSKVWLESPFEGDNGIFDADVLISDYSGISFEFVALHRRPVISVDVGPKVVNPNWQLLHLRPIELAYRSLLGPVVPPDVDAIVDAARSCLSKRHNPSDTTVSKFLHGTPGECGGQAVVQLQNLLTGD